MTIDPNIVSREDVMVIFTCQMAGNSTFTLAGKPAECVKLHRATTGSTDTDYEVFIDFCSTSKAHIHGL